MKRNEADMNQADINKTDINEPDELGTLFAAARELTPADLGAADRFLAANVLAANAGTLGRSGGQRRALRLWAGAVLGAAAALGGLTLLGPSGLRPAPADLPASAAYSVYQSAIGEGW